MKRPETQVQQNQRALDELEERIELLRVAYERYFNGVDAVPPIREHETVKKLTAATMRIHFVSTAQRFRMNTLRARLITHEQYWTRILGQIEKGTFRRVLAESQRRQQKTQAEARARLRAAAQEREQSSESPAANERPAATAPPPPPPTLPRGLDAREARALFDAFVAAKRSIGESTDKLTYPALVRKLAQELPKLQEKHGSSVRLEVATVDGKVKLRARAE